MPRIVLTREAAERIVEAGTQKVYSNLQTLKKPSRTPQSKETEFGHYLGTTAEQIAGPTATTNILDPNDSTTVLLEDVTCPLLRAADNTTNPPTPAEVIKDGTLVIVSKNIVTGEWQIIEAQCPVEETSSSSENSGSSS